MNEMSLMSCFRSFHRLGAVDGWGLLLRMIRLHHGTQIRDLQQGLHAVVLPG